MIELAYRVQPKTRFGHIPIDEASLSQSIMQHVYGRSSARAYVYGNGGKVDGFILGIKLPYEWNKNLYYVTDSLFLAEKGGALLLRKLIRWAKLTPRVQEVILGSSAGDEQADMLYDILGFRTAGGIYYKTLV